jgi:SAM-dependent methyltransferase
LPKIHLTSLWGHQIFQEEIAVFQASLSAIGHEVSYSPDELLPNAINIVFGAITIKTEEIRRLAKHVIIRNLEHVSPDAPCMFPRYIELLKNFPVWDYARSNLPRLAEAGVPLADYVPVCHSTILETITPAPEQDIDVYFYGNITERRAKTLEAVRARGLNVFVSDLGGKELYGAERDSLIARSKVILNLGLYDNKYRVFEIVRVSHLLANGKAVVGEVSDNTDIEEDILSAIVSGSIEELPELCEGLVKDDIYRRTIEQNARQIFQARNGAHIIGAAMARYLDNAVTAMPIEPPRQLKLDANWLGGWRYDFININPDKSTRADLHLSIDAPLPWGKKLPSWRWGEIRLSHGMFDLIIADHVFERVEDLKLAYTNCLDLLKEGGILEILVPYDLDFSAWHDPRTRRAFNEQSFSFPRPLCIELGWRDAYFENTGITYYFSDRGRELLNQHQNQTDQLSIETRCHESMRVRLIKRKMSWNAQQSFEYGKYHLDE